MLMIETVQYEGKVAIFSAKRWDCRSKEDLIEFVTPYHDAQVTSDSVFINQMARTYSSINHEALLDSCCCCIQKRLMGPRIPAVVMDLFGFD